MCVHDGSHDNNNNKISYSSKCNAGREGEGEREGDRGEKNSPVDFQTVGVESQTKEATSESHLHCNPSDEAARKNKIKSSKSHSARPDDAWLPCFPRAEGRGWWGLGE